jgi:hypothetical protein
MNYKTSTKVLFVILLIAMIPFGKSSAQVQGGTFFVDKSTPNFTLHANEGKREAILEINFDKPFTEKPVVLVSLSLIDLQGEKFEVDTNLKGTKEFETRGLKIATEATGVSRDGFVLKVVVWGNTKINAAGGSWVAFK